MPDLAGKAAAYHAQAQALREAGRHREATGRCRQALRLFEKAVGARHPDTANVLLELGRNLELADDLAGARAAYQRAERILRPFVRRLLPVLRRLRLHAFRALGGLARAQGRLPDADRWLARAFRLARSLDADDLDRAALLNELGILRKYQGRYADALPFYRRALAILRRNQLQTSADAASIHHNLGGIEHARGRYARGEPHARRAVALRIATRGPRHPEVAADLAALAAILEGRGERGEARRLYITALTIFRRTHGPRSYELSVNLANLASVCQAEGRLRRAEALYRKALGIQERLLGAGHTEVAMTLNNLGVLLRDAGRVAEGLGCFRRALGVFRRRLGHAHPHTRRCAENLGAAQHSTNLGR